MFFFIFKLFEIKQPLGGMDFFDQPNFTNINRGPLNDSIYQNDGPFDIRQERFIVNYIFGTPFLSLDLFMQPTETI